MCVSVIHRERKTDRQTDRLRESRSKRDLRKSRNLNTLMRLSLKYLLYSSVRINRKCFFGNTFNHSSKYTA